MEILTEEQQAKLREPFPKGDIKYRGKFAYTGHALVTDRILDVDRFWTWEPVAFTEQGLPQFDALGGLWIKLTICGVTRYGYGDAEAKKGPNAIKEAIGDAIRNAALRFGVSIDLWGANFRSGFDDQGNLIYSDHPQEERPRINGEKELASQFSASIEKAKSLDDLRTLWTRTGSAHKVGQLSAEAFGVLTDLMSARKAQLEIDKEATALIADGVLKPASVPSRPHP